MVLAKVIGPLRQYAPKIASPKGKGSATKLDLDKENIILVTSAFHMKRAKKVFEREGIKVQGYPVDFNGKQIKNIYSNPLNWFPNVNSLRSSSIGIREIIGRIIYRAL